MTNRLAIKTIRQTSIGYVLETCESSEKSQEFYFSENVFFEIGKINQRIKQSKKGAIQWQKKR